MENNPETEKKLEGYIRFGGGGHEGEYTLNLEGYGMHAEFIPQDISNSIQKELGGVWVVDNRGTRLEIMGKGAYGKRDDKKILEAVNKVLGDKYKFVNG